MIRGFADSPTARLARHVIRWGGQYRICFVWKADGAHDVEIRDCHRAGH